MKYAGAFVLFVLIFLGAGVAMHSAIYERPGVFVWSLEEDPATGKTALQRTTLALATSVAPAPAAEVASAAPKVPEAKSAEAKPAGESKDAAPVPAVAANSDSIALFDGKTLGKWKKTAFGGEGDVLVDEDGNLEFGFGAVITGVHWGEAPPAKSNYEISLEAMKLDGNDFFIALTFPVKDSHGTFVVGGWGGGVVGISCVDDLNASENETMSIEGFEKDVWYKIRVRVADDRLQAWIDDDEMVSLDLEGRTISLLPGDIELSAPLGIAAYQTRAQYRNIVWKKLPASE